MPEKYIKDVKMIDITHLPKGLKETVYDKLSDYINGNGSLYTYYIGDDGGIPELDALIKSEDPSIEKVFISYWW